MHSQFKMPWEINRKLEDEKAKEKNVRISAQKHKTQETKYNSMNGRIDSLLLSLRRFIFNNNHTDFMPKSTYQPINQKNIYFSNTYLTK